jgi:membrane protease YdiL (CAAX protease family)
MYFGLLAVVGLAISRVSTPNVLTILPRQVPALCSIAAVVVVSACVFDIHPAAYGLDIDRQWISDLLGGIFLGVVYQGIVTAAIITTGAGTVVDRWSMGVFDAYVDVAVAVGATAVAFMIVAVGEDLLFRGVLIREFTTGLTSRNFSRTSATGVAVVAAALLFGSIHLNAGAAGLSTGVVVLQAVVGGLYFGIAYVLTDSLALPVGIHFSTNLWTAVVFGQPDSGYPTAFRLTRRIDLGPDLIVLLLLPAGVLVATVFTWVRATRGEVPEISLGAAN